MIKRELATQIMKASRKFPIVGVVGPRQSGKTTLVKSIFKGYKYVNLEDLDARLYAQEDPRGFLETYNSKVIIDEVQRVPELFSYLQVHVDQIKKTGQFILTGSQNFSIMEKASQSLAGRIAIFSLLPLSFSELTNSKIKYSSFYEYMFMGGYPRVFDMKIIPSMWYPNYIQTYIEKDLRSIQNLVDLLTFQTFLKLCAGRVGQVLNLSSLGQDAGISHNTAKQWISLLQAGFIVHLLPPYYKNFNKRLTKSPKLYFYDTGLVIWLLGIDSKETLKNHFNLGNIFENWIISEYIKSRFNKGLQLNGYYWRDKVGHEVDLLNNSDEKLIISEIKSGKTFNSSFLGNLNYLSNLAGNEVKVSNLIYGGDLDQTRENVNVYSWKSMQKAFG